MPNIILFDTEARDHLLPLTATRPMAELRLGILNVRQKWEHWLKGTASFITKDYLSGKFPIRVAQENLLISAGLLPNKALCDRILRLRLNEALLHGEELIAACLDNEQIQRLVDDIEIEQLEGIQIEEEIELTAINRLWDLTRLNGEQIASDFWLLTQGRTSQPLSATNRVTASEHIFIEEGAVIEHCILNGSNGPIYIGKGAEIMEGCMLRGPVAVGAGAIVKMGAKIYGPTTIGPGCRAGGEITRSILMDNSNKAHDGYLGDSVLGEWCNLGADTNNSNLKNNYSEVKLWDYKTQRFERTGQQFVGLFMGDHSKCGINTMFNTGTVVGVFANVFGAGYQRNFVPDFAWGGPDSSYRTYRMAEATETADAVMARRQQALSEEDKDILQTIFDDTKTFRSWDK
jgi:UDP-N-acetylglucosamine diphosphorylase/glucosamine-1-phosphate N-acetyltransferase